MMVTVEGERYVLEALEQEQRIEELLERLRSRRPRDA